MDTSKFLGKFKDATLDHVQRMNAILLQLELEPDRPDDVTELLREIHTLKGESRMMGFADMSALSHAVEDVLKAQQDVGFRGLSDVVDHVFAALDALRALLDEKLGGTPPGIDVEAECERLHGVARGGAPQPAPSWSPAAATPPAAAPPSVPGAVPSDDLGALDLGDVDLPDEAPPPSPTARVVAEAPVPRAAAAAPPPAPGAPVVGAGVAKFLGKFRDATREHLRRMEEIVLQLEQQPSAVSDVPELMREIHTLKGEARMMGFGEMADLAHAIEDLLKELEAARFADLGARSDLLFEAFDAEGRLLDFHLGATTSAVDVAELATRLRAPGASRVATGEVPAGAPASPARALPTAPAPTPPPAPLVPSAPSPTTTAPTSLRAAPKVEETVRISLPRLEDLGNLSGDIYLHHVRADERLRALRALLQLSDEQAKAAAALRHALTSDGGEGLTAGGPIHDAYEALGDSVRGLRRGIRDVLRRDRDDVLRAGHAIVELRERVRELQLVPVSTLFDMYPRMVRDIGKSLGKDVRLAVEGGHTELDRRILDEIRDPMVHVLRNAVDHGVEVPSLRAAAGKPAQGTVTLSARSEGDHVVIEIEDDGGGIDPNVIRASAVRKGLLSPAAAAGLDDDQAMQLIFTSGFSSKDAVSDLSGRGVGLDVVRDKVDRLEGRINVWSEPGSGTRMALRLPLTLAMARVLLLRAGGLLVAVPATLVEEVVRVGEDAVRRVETYEAIEWQGRTLPLVSLAHVLERDARPARAGRRTVVVTGFEDHLVGFVVDDLEGEREVVVKRLSPFLGRVPNVAGATLLSSGQVVVVLHVPQLVAATMGISPVRLQARVRSAQPVAADRRTLRRLLVVDDSIIVRDMMKGVLEAAGFNVTLAVDGLDGLEKQLAESFDLVITDVEMPRMDGFELTRSIKQNERHARVPVIIVTTLDSPASREKGLRAGASAYVVKNLLDMSQLVTTIERLVA